jgi:universal stress protein A
MDKQSILVAVDFGATSNRAFNTALELAQRLGASLDVVNICPPVPVDVESPAYVDSAQAELDKLRARAEAEGVHTATHVRQETVVFGLLEAIEEIDPLFVVVGSHGRRGVTRLLMGSVSESLARRSHVPVLIVPAPERQEIAAVAAWSCQSCGHILGDGESSASCAQCGETPGHWLSASLSDEPADAGEPAVGAGVADEVAAPNTQDPGVLFATAPMGTTGTVANAEIRIRRF